MMFSASLPVDICASRDVCEYALSDTTTVCDKRKRNESLKTMIHLPVVSVAYV